MILPGPRVSYRAESEKHQREPLDSGPLFRIFPWLFPGHCRQISPQEADLCNVSSTFFILDQFALPEVIREFDSFLFVSYKYFVFFSYSSVCRFHFCCPCAPCITLYCSFLCGRCATSLTPAPPCRRVGVAEARCFPPQVGYMLGCLLVVLFLFLGQQAFRSARIWMSRSQYSYILIIRRDHYLML